ncbi:unnamed protein product [Nesidiocoris tenuis]|uniref:Uncharacterized protein n=1 Tax=Nesidiocoris tenuis TaxID=355587 RepID=A0A6H5GS82_9HEMI|nr:unnamed protein product [Nesidiocoris tenuis]
MARIARVWRQAAFMGKNDRIGLLPGNSSSWLIVASAKRTMILISPNSCRYSPRTSGAPSSNETATWTRDYIVRTKSESPFVRVESVLLIFSELRVAGRFQFLCPIPCPQESKLCLILAVEAKAITSDVPSEEELHDLQNHIEALEITKLTNEIERCKAVRKSMIRGVIAHLRDQIADMWDLMCYTEEQRSAFNAYRADLFNEDTLQLHELELNNLREFYETNKYDFATPVATPGISFFGRF